MNEHERYKEAFANLDTRVTPEQIQALAEAEKGVSTMKTRKPIRTLLIAAVVVLLLAGTVAAAGYYAGWLTPALANAEEESEFLEKTVEPDASVEVSGERWTVNKVLAEGSHVFMEYTRERLDGSPVPEDWPEKCSGWVMYLLDAEGQVQGTAHSSHGVSFDTSNPAKPVEVRSFTIDFGEKEPNWENATLKICMDDKIERENQPAVYTLPVEEPSYREATLENGDRVRIGKISMLLYSDMPMVTDITGQAYFDLACAGKPGLILSDGTIAAIDGATILDYLDMRLAEIIDPNDVTAFTIGGVTYPIS